MRVPNAPTAAADVLAGALLAGAGGGQAAALVVLCLASMCLYTGGIVLNDVADARRDAQLRPERPIPAGQVRRPTAVALTTGLLLAGVALAEVASLMRDSLVQSSPAQDSLVRESLLAPSASGNPFPRDVLTASFSPALVALALIGAIVAYDVVLKTTFLASGVMGLCRALNLLMGASLVGSIGQTHVLYAASAIWLYITSLTVFARRESGGGYQLRLAVGAAGVGIAVCGRVALESVYPTAHRSYLWLAGAMLACLLWRALRAVADATPARVQQAVQLMIFCLVLLDASLAWAVRGPAAGAVVATMLVPAVLLGRWFRGT